MPHRLVWQRLKNFLVRRVLRAKDTPHRIALGVAIGVFVAWTPTIGFQMALTLALAWLLGANKLVGVPFVWISNPLTVVPIYLPNYYVGRWILGSKVPPPDFSRVAGGTGGWLAEVNTWWSVTWHAFLPLWVGSLLVAVALSVPTYFATYHAVIIYRRKMYAFRRHRLDRKRRRELSQLAEAAEPEDEPARCGAPPD